MHSNKNELLSSKLMPPHLHSTAIKREDLLTRLDGGLKKKLTLVTAPTGFGKTTLVSQWIATRVFPSAWMTLDVNDNDPARFWTYVVSALRTMDSSLGRITLSTLMASQPTSFEALLTPLLNELKDLKEPCVMVLEDFHVITSEEINAGMSFFIRYLPESLHLVIVTRTEPNLPLGLLRARDELLEVNSSKLRFDQGETERFLHEALQADFPSSFVDEILQKTEGWAAGLRLLAMSVQGRGITNLEKLVQSFSGSDRHVADYLIKEVFEYQPEATQAFLLRTCFLNRLTGSLCAAVTGDSDGAAKLEKLERDNLFILQLEHGGRQTWYRYNPLFAESIQVLARQRLGEEGVREIFEKASAWYEYQQLYDEAIETALTAKLFPRALTLIVMFIEIHDITELHTLSRWMECIPENEILRYPTICFAYAQVILYTSDRFAPATAARIEPLLRSAESTWRSEDDHRGIGRVLSFRGMVAFWQGDFQKAFEYARASLEEIPEHDAMYRGTSLLLMCYEAFNAGRVLDAQDKILEARALLGAAQNIYGVLAATQMLSEIFFWQGELEQAGQLNRQILAEALETVGGESMLDDQGIASLGLANIAYERNDLEEAEQFSGHAQGFAEKRGNEILQMQASIRLASVYAARGHIPEGRELVKSLESQIRNPSLLREVQCAQAALAIRANDLSSLDGWQAMLSSDRQNGLHLQKERDAFTLARLYIEQGKPRDALKTLKGRSIEAAENGRIRSQVEALCLEAMAHHADANLSRAIELLNEALTLGHSKGFRRLFLDGGARMAALIQAAVSSFPSRTLSLFAATLLHSFLPEETALRGPANSTVQVEALSQQEIRVLRLLVTGMSNADIARELVVSTNTIKTHVKSIYRKLSVNSREDAREMARELKLV